MGAQFMRAAAIAALTSAVGCGVAYLHRSRQRRLQRIADRDAIQAWETDGGSNLAPRSTETPQRSGPATRALY